MASDHAFENAEEMLSGARVGRLEITVFRHNTNIPGETAALARAFWLHVPELAKRMGAEISPEEGHPPQVSVSDESLVKMIASDISAGRPYASWLATHIGPQTSAMFAKGGENAFDSILDKFAADRGFARDDAFTQEASKPARAYGVAAAMHAARGFSL